MTALAPGRFSTTIGWPSASESSGETARSTESVGPPGGTPTVTLMGFEG